MIRRRRKLLATGGRAGGGRFHREKSRDKTRPLTSYTSKKGRVGGQKMRGPMRVPRINNYSDVSKVYNRTNDIVNATAPEPRNHTDVHNLTKNAPEGTTFKIKGTEYSTIKGGTSTTAGDKSQRVPFEKSMSQRSVLRPGLGGQRHKEKRINLTTGKPTSRVLKQLSKLNGTYRRVLYDTKIPRVDITGNTSTRDSLTHSCGFNSRNYWVMPPLSYPTMDDVHAFTNIPIAFNDLQNPGVDARIYASVLEATSQIHIYNQNAYHPMKIKFHMVKPASKNEFRTNPQFFRDEIVPEILPAAIDSPTLIPSGIPAVFLHSGAVLEGLETDSTGQIHWDMSNKSSGLMSSAKFRENFHVVETSTCKMEAGEHLQINHKHYFGGGVDLSALLTESVTTGQAGDGLNPLSYFYIIESCGYPCEAIHNRFGLGTQQYLGTNPCFYACEYRKMIKYVLSDTRSIALASSSLQGDPNSSAIHTRTFTREPYSFANVEGSGTGDFNREFFALPADIEDSLPPAVGKTAVPVMSDARVRLDSVTGNQGD